MLIRTKYHPATNSRGARISAEAPAWGMGRVYISYPHEKSGADCHVLAARALLQKNNWSGPWIFEAASVARGYVFYSNQGLYNFNLLED